MLWAIQGLLLLCLGNVGAQPEGFFFRGWNPVLPFLVFFLENGKENHPKNKDL